MSPPAMRPMLLNQTRINLPEQIDWKRKKKRKDWGWLTLHTKTGRVVIPHGLGIAVRLQHRVGLHHLVLKGGLLLLPLLWLLSS